MPKKPKTPFRKIPEKMPKNKSEKKRNTKTPGQHAKFDVSSQNVEIARQKRERARKKYPKKRKKIPKKRKKIQKKENKKNTPKKR